MDRYYAHSGRSLLPDDSDWQYLATHLAGVAELASKFAEPLRMEGCSLKSAAFAAGWLHDLGKYRIGFQRMIRGQPVRKESTYHKQAGAAYAIGLSKKHRAIACAVAGHHGGLPSTQCLDEAVERGRPVVEEIRETAFNDCTELAGLVIPPDAAQSLIQCDLETRLVFSCLVDADWSDTAEHDRRVRGWDEDPEPARLDKRLAEVWLARVLEVIRTRAGNCPRQEVAQARSDVLAACLEVARKEEPGLFSLTVPTGGGKTLSALAFALAHAAESGLRRIIYVAPYLSILDQNARAIREALNVGRDGIDVFEHHSLGDNEDVDGPRRPGGRRTGTPPSSSRRTCNSSKAFSRTVPAVAASCTTSPARSSSSTSARRFRRNSSRRPARCSAS